MAMNVVLVVDCTGGIRVMELFTGITEQEASNQ